MYTQLTDEARNRVTEALRRAAPGAVRDGDRGAARARRPGDSSSTTATVRVPIVVRTRIFGRLTGTVDLRDRRRRGRHRRRLAPGARLPRPGHRRGAHPDGRDAAAGDAQEPRQRDPRRGRGPHPRPAVADIAPDVVGRLGAGAAGAARSWLRAASPRPRSGSPGSSSPSTSGCSARPAARLRAGARVLAETKPRRAAAVRSTVSPAVSAPRSPGWAAGSAASSRSTRARARCSATPGSRSPGCSRRARRSRSSRSPAPWRGASTSEASTYPVETGATLEGVKLENANGELCGGTLAGASRSPATRSSPPWAPSWARRSSSTSPSASASTAPPLLPGAAIATIPQADEIGDDLAVGSSAIGQGRVLATALQMAVVSATIANGGSRPRLTMDLDVAKAAPRAPMTRVTTPKVAATVQEADARGGDARDGQGGGAPRRLGRGQDGDRRAEVHPELRHRARPRRRAGRPRRAAPRADASDTDAWFAAFAPAGASTAAGGRRACWSCRPAPGATPPPRSRARCCAPSLPGARA